VNFVFLGMMLMKKAISFIFALVVLIATVPRVEASTSRDEVVNIAKEQLGAPYQFGGTTPKGFDCSGFIKYVFDKVGIELPRTASEQYNTGIKVDKEDLQPGDLVFFENTYKAGISHSGIYIGDQEFISATTSKGVTTASLDSSYWGPKFAGGKRVIDDHQLPPGQFYDVSKEHPAYKAISELSKTGVITGFEGSYFKPELHVTRGQAAAILNRYLKLTASSKTSFKDVSSGMTFAKDIAAIKEAGIITGFDDGTFRPNDKLTRAQMAVIMDRAFKISSLPFSSKVDVKYKDVSTKHWAYTSIIALKRVDSTNVFNSFYFRAADYATRADYAAAAYVAIQAAKK
jgi:peptidoglycan DL-endopeptidase CwlO